jgi:sulfonate transport system substrate-binding protein
MQSKLRQHLAAWLSVLLLAGLPACKKSPTPRPTSPASVSAYEPVEIRYSDPGNGGVSVLAYAKREGILERELAKVNATLKWVPGPGAFSASFEAMNTGAINTAGGCISPIVGALAHNLKFKIYGLSEPSAMKQAGIIVPAGSPITTLKQLVGKRVAVNLAAHGDYILLKALDNAGIPTYSVTRVPIQPPEAAAAFATGKIDAWSTFGVFFSTAKRNGARVLAYEADVGSDDVNVHSANATVLEKNPAAFQVLLRVINELTDLAHEHPERFQNVYTDKGPTALAGDELRLAIENTRVLPKVRIPTVIDRKRIENVTQLLFANKSIDRAPSVDEIVFNIDAHLNNKLSTSD